jgi:hypothetical protein
MEQRIRCYISDDNQRTVLSCCPCTCHTDYQQPDRIVPPQLHHWADHNGISCDDWVNARFVLEGAQVDLHRRAVALQLQRLELERGSTRGHSVSRVFIDDREVGVGPVTWE